MNTASSSVCTLQDLILDAQSTSGKTGIANFSNVNALRIDFKNLNAVGGISCGTSSVNAVLDKCTATSANGCNTTSYLVQLTNSGAGITIKGCTSSGIGGFFSANSPTLTTTSIVTTTSSDGTRNTCYNCNGIPFYIPYNAVQTYIDIECIDFSGTYGTALSVITDSSHATTTVTSLVVKNCTFTSSSIPAIMITGTYGAVDVSYCTFVGTGAANFFRTRSNTITSPKVYNNTITLTSSTTDAISIAYGTGTPKVYNNKITSDSTFHLIEIGVDGQTTLLSNAASSTGSISLGDTAAHTYFYQPVTTVAGVSSSAIPSSIRFMLKAVGAPTGTVTAYLYSDNSGVPGTLLNTSEYNLAATALSTSTWYWHEFWFPTHVAITFGSVYHLVLKYTGTNDSTNYVILNANATGTVSGYSSSGSTWATAANTAFYQLMMGAFEIVDPEVHDNTLIFTTSALGTHMAIIGGTIGGKIYNNILYSGAIGIIMKLVDGTDSVNHPALMYNNVVYMYNTANGYTQACRCKGTRGVQVYYNTLLLNGAGSNALFTVDADYESITTPQYNAQPSINTVFKNNIAVGLGATGSPAGYTIGEASSAYLSDNFIRAVNTTINNNILYFADSSFGAFCNNYSNLATTTSYATYAAMQAAGIDVNGKNINPGIGLTPAKLTDWIPTTQANIRIGTPITGITVDARAVTRSTSKPEVGALMPLRRLAGSTRLYRV